MAKLIACYNGTDYFWNYAYRHSLRDCSVKARRQVFAAYKRAGLDCIGLTAAHTAIVLRYTAKDATRLRKMGASDSYEGLVYNDIPNSLMRVKPFGC